MSALHEQPCTILGDDVYLRNPARDIHSLLSPQMVHPSLKFTGSLLYAVRFDLRRSLCRRQCMAGAAPLQSFAAQIFAEVLCFKDFASKSFKP